MQGVLDELRPGKKVNVVYYGDTVQAAVGDRYTDGSLALHPDDGGRVFVYPQDIRNGKVVIR